MHKIFFNYKILDSYMYIDLLTRDLSTSKVVMIARINISGTTTSIVYAIS